MCIVLLAKNRIQIKFYHHHVSYIHRVSSITYLACRLSSYTRTMCYPTQFACNHIFILPVVRQPTINSHNPECSKTHTTAFHKSL